MAIDYADWHRTTFTDQPTAPSVEYRTIELSDAWDQLQSWLKEQETEMESALVSAVDAMKFNGEYSHEALLKSKTLVDIRHAELRILRLIGAKVASYHSKEAMQ